MRSKPIQMLFVVGLGGSLVAAALAAPGGIPGPPGGGETEAGSNNLSFPLICSDGARPAGYVDDDDWTFFAGPWSDDDADGVPDQCTTGVPDGSAVPGDAICYWDGADVWWLQQRVPNHWQAFDPVDPDPSTPVVISAVDWGDLLESSPNLNLRKIRTEVTLLMDATTDPDFSSAIATFPVTIPFESPCPSCFAAFPMSGAVPGTDQSINEIQGTSFGPGLGDYPGDQTLIDPTTIKTDLVTGRGFHATVYSQCARFVIQKVTGDPATLTWSSTDGYWGPISAVGTPAVNLAAYDGGYTPEINASGTLIYGYNWNAKADGEGEGLYRMTLVFDGGPAAATPRCDVALNTLLDASTIVANPGEVTQGQIVTPLGVQALGGDGSEGGLTYLDVFLRGGKGSGGGSGGGGPPHGK